MPCPQCGANMKAGARCKRKTCKWAPKCHSHTSVRIGSSGVSGRGLFAKKPIRKNEAPPWLKTLPTVQHRGETL